MSMLSSHQSTSHELLRIHRLVKVILAMVVVVIALGAYTRLADAGLGCPDWPGCYGQLVVPSGELAVSQANMAFPERTVEPFKAWLEMIHRYFAGTLGLMVFVMAWMCLKDQQAPKALPIAISVLIIGQALLGMWTVTLKLMPVIVMAHLLGGFTLFVLLALLHYQLLQLRQRDVLPLTMAANANRTSTLNSMQNQQQPFPLCQTKRSQQISVQQDQRLTSNGILIFGIFAWCVLVMQILLGGWTSTNYAALMCTTLPICQGDWLSNLDWSTAFSFWQVGHDNYEFGVLEYPARMTIHVVHRIGAMCTAVVLGGYALSLIRGKNGHSKRMGVVILILLTLQILLGIGNVVLQLPIGIAVAHNMVGALLLVASSISIYQLWIARIVIRKEGDHEPFECTNKR